MMALRLCGGFQIELCGGTTKAPPGQDSLCRTWFSSPLSVGFWTFGFFFFFF